MERRGEFPAALVRGPCLVVGRGFAACVIRHDLHFHTSVAYAQRRLECFDYAGAFRGADAQAILYDFERLVAALADARVTLLLEQRAHFGLREILRDRDWEGDLKTRIAGCRGAPPDFCIDRVWTISPHRLAAAATVQLRRARLHQFDVIV